jgi:uncharacterized protein (DUF924 family)
MSTASTTDVSVLPDPPWVPEVLRFWFEELTRQQWFRRDTAVDDRIRARFGALHERLVAQEHPDVSSPASALATVLVLDQFSRNLYRGDARAFAADPLARRVARAALERGFDRGLDVNRRMFFYLPFEHSEDREDQRFAIERFEATGEPELVRYARQHQAVIERFGRFPHRNAVLGRPSTAEELAFLENRQDWAAL